jgi:hypothetical protein
MSRKFQEKERRKKRKKGEYKKAKPKKRAKLSPRKLLEKVAQSGKEKIRQLWPNSPVPHQCDAAGRCCFSTGVGLVPVDVWRLVTSPKKTLEKLGFDVQTTRDLFETSDALFQTGIGPISKMPMAMIRTRAFEGVGVQHCPFLRWDGSEKIEDEPRNQLRVGKIPRGLKFWTKSDGSPRFRCGLGAERPVQCEMYPVSRVIRPGNEEKSTSYQMVYSLDKCQRCLPQTIKATGVTAGDLTKDPVKQVYLKASMQYVELMDRVKREEVPEDARAFLCHLLFDFDSSLLDAGASPEMVVQMRPKDPRDIVKAAHAFLDELAVRGEGEVSDG